VIIEDTPAAVEGPDVLLVIFRLGNRFGAGGCCGASILFGYG
jgi:hypothetical protein